jgi:hypothetical protein
MTKAITSYEEKHLIDDLSEVIAETLKGEHRFDFGDAVATVIAGNLTPGQVFEDSTLREWVREYVAGHGIDALGLEVQE